MNWTAKLSSRELQVAELLVFGKSKKEVAETLFISAFTVDNHLRKIFYKTETNKIGALATWYFVTMFRIDLSDRLRALITIMLFTITVGTEYLNTSEALRHRAQRHKTVKCGRARRTEYCPQGHEF